MSDAPSVDLAAIWRVKWAERPLFGSPQGYAACSSDPFRTVSLRASVNRGEHGQHVDRPELLLYLLAHALDWFEVSFARAMVSLQETYYSSTRRRSCTTSVHSTREWWPGSFAHVQHTQGRPERVPDHRAFPDRDVEGFSK